MEFSASSIEPSVQTPTSTTRSSRSWRYSTSEMSSSSVREPRHPAQGVPLGEVLLTGGQLGVARSRRRTPTRHSASSSSSLAGLVLEVPADGLVQLGVEGEVFACVRHMPSRVGRRPPSANLFAHGVRRGRPVEERCERVAVRCWVGVVSAETRNLRRRSGVPAAARGHAGQCRTSDARDPESLLSGPFTCAQACDLGVTTSMFAGHRFVRVHPRRAGGTTSIAHDVGRRRRAARLALPPRAQRPDPGSRSSPRVGPTRAAALRRARRAAPGTGGDLPAPDEAASASTDTSASIPAAAFIAYCSSARPHRCSSSWVTGCFNTSHMTLERAPRPLAARCTVARAARTRRCLAASRGSMAGLDSPKESRLTDAAATSPGCRLPRRTTRSSDVAGVPIRRFDLSCPGREGLVVEFEAVITRTIATSTSRHRAFDLVRDRGIHDGSLAPAGRRPLSRLLSLGTGPSRVHRRLAFAVAPCTSPAAASYPHGPAADRRRPAWPAPSAVLSHGRPVLHPLVPSPRWVGATECTRAKTGPSCTAGRARR